MGDYDQGRRNCKTAKRTLMWPVDESKILSGFRSLYTDKWIDAFTQRVRTRTKLAIKSTKASFEPMNTALGVQVIERDCNLRNINACHLKLKTSTNRQ